MTPFYPRRSIALLAQRWRMSPPHLATLLMVGAVVLSGAIVAAWFSGQGAISRVFQQWNQLQEHPPMWIEAPMMVGQYALYWTVALTLFVLLILQLSPRPQAWSRSIVIGILLILTVRYLTWRSLSTLNLSTPLNGVFSLGLYGMELLLLSGGLIQLVLLLRIRDRRPEADQRSIAVLDGTFAPTVDVLIPTYNEAPFILQRTVLGCQALDYPNKTIYLLDDTRRPEVAALAKELGCEYLTRPDNRHAKAGNLNHALAQTQGELIVVFDADFVPTRNFLIRTVGFFQDPEVALVQTPQTFYNPDPIARNLGLEDVLTPDEEVFYRQIQPIRDGAGSVICAGTSFVMRRSALTATGCFVTESLSEDYFTGIRLAASGYRLVYLNEKLSAGLAADSIAVQALQRVRWAQGTLQAFFIQTNPLTIPGLTPIQRLAHLEGLLHWFTSLARVGLLLMPLAYSFLGVIPLRATGEDLLYFFLPFYLVSFSTAAWLNFRARSALLGDVYSLVLVFPLALTVIKVMLNPFGKGFKVTPKGGVSDRFSFNWQLAYPLIIFFMVTAVSLWTNLGMYLLKGGWQPGMSATLVDQVKGLGIGWIWSAYNLVMLSVALLILIDVPRPSPFEWYNLRRTVRLNVEDGAESPAGFVAADAGRSPASVFSVWGMTTALSEIGAEVELTQKNLLMASPMQATLEFVEEGFTVQTAIERVDSSSEFFKVRLRFESLPLKQRRRLIELLYCRPGQWRDRCSPNEFQSLWLLLKVLLRPRVLFDRKVDIRPIRVAQS